MTTISNNGNLQIAAVAAAVVALALAGGSAGAEGPAVATGRALLDEVGVSARLGEKLPLDRTFVDSFGRQVRLAECFSGRPVVLHLVYYECPMLCKLSSDGLFSALATLSLRPGDDFSIVTLSFDPGETAELAARARELAVARSGEETVRRGWRFLTGDESAIAAVTDAAGFRYALDETTGEYAHASGVFVLTPDGTISHYLSGIHYSPRDLRLALVEASGGRVGTTTDQVLLLCYMYDPATGKYGLAIMTLLRAAAVATVGGWAIAIVAMLRRERRINSKERATSNAGPTSDTRHPTPDT